MTYLGPSGSQIGHKESMKDTARVLGRMYDGIEYRGFGQEIVEELAEYAGVPVWNGLTDEFHPTQILADFLTMHEHSDKPLTQIAYCYLGDARNNMGDSLLVGGAKLGMDVRLCAPEGALAATTSSSPSAGRSPTTPAPGSRSPTTPAEGVKGVDFLYTDVWVSMGEDKSVWDERVKLLKPYQVNARAAGDDRQPARQVHALPAGVPRPRTPRSARRCSSSSASTGSRSRTRSSSRERSIVFDQAENRMHTIKAVMVATLGD